MICARSDNNGNNENSGLLRIRKLSNSLSKDAFFAKRSNRCKMSGFYIEKKSFCIYNKTS